MLIHSKDEESSQQGFTLIEVIVVIVIVGVLASLASVRFFETVEFSRSTEARYAIGELDSSFDRCLLASNDDRTVCTSIEDLDLEDPANGFNSHFTYSMQVTPAFFRVIATRNTRNGGNTANTITYESRLSPPLIRWNGTGPFEGLK